jgi:BirA family biotin operon repressor/biotin-[acetyl-CoA-carboxylase] ligase
MHHEPDAALSAAEVTRDLGTRLVGRRVIYYPRLTSTMDVAREEARQGGAEGTVVVADQQTAGRGRLKRSWLAPAGNIALSVLLYPRLVELPSLIMLASLGVVHSIETVTGIRPDLKWPNDVLVRGRKVCGILIETDARVTAGERVTHAIIGVGINVNLDPAVFPEIEPTATSLSRETGGEVSRLSLVRDLLAELDRLYQGLRTGTSLYPEWHERLVTLGQQVRVHSVEAVYEGIAESADRDGSLLVRTAAGELKRVVAGDVTLRN